MCLTLNRLLPPSGGQLQKGAELGFCSPTTGRFCGLSFSLTWGHRALQTYAAPV
ncbi:MAG: hypothetical protein ACI853_002153 [Paracoccaceae bacterium]|jgi:hypothetical protein